MKKLKFFSHITKTLEAKTSPTPPFLQLRTLIQMGLIEVQVSRYSISGTDE